MIHGVHARRSVRQAVSFPVLAGWDSPAGVPLRVRGLCVNVSEQGLCLQLRDRIPVGTFVSFRFDGRDVQGTGSVRHCQRRGLNYYVGLAMNGTSRLQVERMAGPR